MKEKMKKKLKTIAILLILVLILGMFLVGCGSPADNTDESVDVDTNIEINDTGDTTDGPKYVFNENHKIMVEGKMYYSTGEESKLSVRSEKIDGEIMHIIGETEIPGRDNEATFGDIGYEFQRVGDTFIEVHMADTDQWIIFEEGPFEPKTYVFDGKEYTSEELWNVTGGKHAMVDGMLSGSGFETDWNTTAFEIGNVSYHPITDNRFESINDIKEYIETLVTPNLAATDFYWAFAGDTPMIMEKEGKLYHALGDKGTPHFATYTTRIVEETSTSAIIEVDGFDGWSTYTVLMLKSGDTWLVDLVSW